MRYCKVCGCIPKGNGRTCNKCLSKGLKWCNSCRSVLTLDKFIKRNNGTYHSKCIDCENKKYDTIELDVPERLSRRVLQRCATCFYVGYVNGYGNPYCDYLNIVGTSRKCSPVDCIRYKEGKTTK